MLVAAFNRCSSPTSKSKIGEWYDWTILPRVQRIDPKQLTSQRFWDNMDLITEEEIIPEFKTEEEARFWDEHDSIEFIDDFESVDIKVAPELEEESLNRRELKKPITLRLEPKQVDAVKKIAFKKGLPYQTLIRMWITERMKLKNFKVATKWQPKLIFILSAENQKPRKPCGA